MEKAGLHLKCHKCAFLIEYLGHTISPARLRPSSKKVEAATTAPAQTDVPQLRSFLGLMNFYDKFSSNLASVLAPLYKLLVKEIEWLWETQQMEAFNKEKSTLTSTQLLAHFDPEKDLIISCNASPYVGGAVLAHKIFDRTERHIMYASKSLTAAERRYSQLDKKCLAVILTVNRFHLYIYGQKFIIYILTTSQLT